MGGETPRRATQPLSHCDIYAVKISFLDSELSLLTLTKAEAIVRTLPLKVSGMGSQGRVLSKGVILSNLYFKSFTLALLLVPDCRGTRAEMERLGKQLVQLH